MHDARAEYTRRLAARRAVAERHHRLHIRLGNGKLAVAALLVVLAWLAFVEHVVSCWWLTAPAASFVALLVIHERVLRALERAGRAVIFYEQALARLDGRWAGVGEPGDRFLDDAHPYARDLDLFGRGSLFQLLSTARTRSGEETLARWLLEPAPPEVIRARQAAIAELRDKLDLREDLAVLGEDVRAGVHPEALAAWGEARPLLDSRPARIAAAILAASAVAGAVLWIVQGNRTVFFAAAAVEAILFFLHRSRIRLAVEAVELPAHDLDLLAAVLVRLERERFASPRLMELRAALDTEGHPPSQRIARLDRWVELLDSRDHLLLRIFGPPLLYTTQLAFAVEAWRKNTGPHVRGWLEAAGEIEALSALAGYAYEHRADPFPEFCDPPARFEGEGLGHPLLPEGRCVSNDVRLGPDQRVLVVSGSNMSGKSTLLRTIGTNAVLAMAGAPVRARKLALTPLALGATIRVVDSLQGGTSRFYTEITRLRRFVDLTARTLSLLFLLDELLHGTNSHDRRIGAEAVVRGLVERGAIGLLTTHDLALAHIADAIQPHGANVHFEDHLENGRITFDYRLRPGVVRKSNALELMRSVGLEV